MPKVKIEATKLVEPKVTHISLVRHGANRVPFRVVKQADQESGMIDLGNIFRVGKADSKAVTPQIVALVVEKSDHIDLIKETVAEAGFIVDKAEETQDGAVILKQVDEDINLDECHVVKMSDDLLIITKGFSCWDDCSDLSFMDQINAQSFFPSVSTAGYVLQSQISNILKSAKGMDDSTKSELTTLLDDFKTYVMAQAQSIPSQAFKLEADLADKLTVAKAEKAEKADGGEVASADGNQQASVEGDGAGAPENVVKGEQEGQTAAQEGDGAGAADASSESLKKVEDSLRSVQETVGKLTEMFTASLEPVHKAVSDLTTQVTAIKEQGESLAAKITEVEAVAKSAETAAKGKVNMAPPAGDVPGAGVKKQENSQYSGLFDTAFMPGRNRH